MSFNHYYQSELIALRELGKDFAERNPALAPFFNTPGRDPDVERILEGFAFLSGRLRQKLDDELPEITHALFNLLWPNYLRPIPSCSVVQFTPMGAISKLHRISGGVELDSVPVKGVPCTFSTVYETEILPIKIVEQKVNTKGGQASLVLRFKTLDGPLENLSFDKLRIFFSGDSTNALTLYYYFLKKVRGINLNVAEGDAKSINIGKLGPEAIRPVGFAKEEALFPYPSNAFPGFRILQEYFCFPAKFMFVDIVGLDSIFNKEKLAEAGAPDVFELSFMLEDLPDNFESFRLNNFQLFCTPVINLFPKSATPLTMDNRQNEYRIVPDPRYPEHFSTYSVDLVEGWEHSGKGTQEYKAFETFAGAVGSAGYYRLRVKPSPKDAAMETYISIVHHDSKKRQRKQETVSLELTCTNRLFPKELKVGDICIPTDNSPEAVSFKNIVPVTPPYMPPLEGDMLWKLLSNMSLNYIPLTNINALRGILAAYDFSATQNTVKNKILQNTMQGMVSVEYQETDRIYRGLPLRGGITRLCLDQSKFSCKGGMYLFASVLNEFFVMYATINSFHQLIVTEHTSGEEYKWQPRLGELLL